MTEIKWSLVFSAVFLTLVFGLEYELQLVKGLTVTKIQYNLQLDTCLADTLRKAEISFCAGEPVFYNPDGVRKELEKQLAFAFSHSFGTEKGEGETLQQRGNAQDRGIALLILYESDGFYFFAPEMEEVSEKVAFRNREPEEKLFQLETFMETELNKRLSGKGKKESLCFTFPKEERSIYGQTVKGTGLLLVYEAEEAYFQGSPYERFILSGARVEE